MTAQFDMLLRNSRLDDASCDIGVRDGRIVAIGQDIGTASCTRDLDGRVVIPGLVETHIHLDKAGLLCRCGQAGGLAGAVAAVSAAKRNFTVQDVYERAARVIRAAITQGTMYMRTHVEVDPRAGMRSFQAMLDLKREFAFALDLSICAFAQEGLTNDPGTESMLEQALEQGADLLGGCPYTDTDPVGQITRLFDMALRHDVDLDFHLDFDLDPDGSHMDAICDATVRHGWQGRVNIGHVTKLAMMDDAMFSSYADMLAQAGVAVTALPSTDLYLNGIEMGHRAPRGIAPVHLLAQAGVAVSVATNNVMNPFTPYGDSSLIRMANLYANTMHLGADHFGGCLGMVTHDAARILRLSDYGLHVGAWADLLVLDAPNGTEAFASIAQPLMGFKRGRQSFDRPAATILNP